MNNLSLHDTYQGFLSSDCRANRFLFVKKYNPSGPGWEVPSPPRCPEFHVPLSLRRAGVGAQRGLVSPAQDGLGSRGGWRGLCQALASAKLHWGGPEGLFGFFNYHFYFFSPHEKVLIYTVN